MSTPRPCAPAIRASIPRLSALALCLSLPLFAALSTACGDASSSASTSSAADAKPARMSFEVILLDDAPDPFATLPPNAPAGLSQFQEVVVLGPEAIDTRTYVRLVVQPGETLAQARTRAKPWFDAIRLPPGDRLVFSEIVEDDEIAGKRVAVGARTYVATSTVALTRDDVAGASVGAMPDGDGKPHPVAMVQLTQPATERFQKFTKESLFRRLGVMVDGNLVMAARIQEEISGGKISISLDPDLPFEARRAELERIVKGISPEGTAPAAAPTAAPK